MSCYELFMKRSLVVHITPGLMCCRMPGYRLAFLISSQKWVRMTNEGALIHEMLHNHRDMLKAGGVGFAINIYTGTYFRFTKQYGNFSLPTPQRHPRSFPGCPTRPRGWLGRSERGSGTARSPSPDRRLFSASCHSAALAQSGTGVSHSADKADKEKKENT